jgi:hypothetical protein
LPHDYDPGDSNLDDVCDRLDKIEAAVRANHRDLGWVVMLIIVWLAWAGFTDFWYSKLRYSWWYGVDSDQVTIEKEPADCNFLHAPLGGKGCHYYPQVRTIKVKTQYIDFQRGSVNYVSFDDGKTWAVDDATPPTKPQVIVSWDRVEDQ